MVWLIDFTGWTMAHATPIKTARESTSILQNYYPERLSTAFLFNPPKVFEAFYKVMALNPAPFVNLISVSYFIHKDSKSICRIDTEKMFIFFYFHILTLASEILRSFQAVKYFLDPRSIEKVNFVYLKDEESMKVLYRCIDPEVLPVDFGGRNNVLYNHEEYTKLMLEDDIKTSSFWADDAKPVNRVANGTLVADVRPQSPLIAAKAS